MNDLKVDTNFYKARSLSKRIQDISYILSQLEFKHPLNSLTSEKKVWLTRTYLAIQHDLETLLDDFEKLKKETENV